MFGFSYAAVFEQTFVPASLTNTRVTFVMKYKDYYQIMDVTRDATQDEIKRAYRKLARKYHPDISKEPQAEAHFKEVGEAYDVLKDPEKRAAYDQLGANYQAGQDFKPPPDWNNGFEHAGRFGGEFGNGGAGYSDFFEGLFGRGFGQQNGTHRQQARGQDHQASVQIDLEDAYRGATRSINLRAAEVDAHGRVGSREHTLNVTIPAGIRAGQRIRLKGQGAQGQGGAGDLYLDITFNPHTNYRVDGRDVYLDLPVSPWEAALGADVKVPTPEGVVSLKIPAGAVAGRKLRLKGRGIPAGASKDSTAGDFYVLLQMVAPAVDSEKARSFYSSMAKEFSEFNPRASLGVSV